MEWIKLTDQKPENGQMIVKKWLSTGNVWAGKHIAHPKYESFDLWIPLPK